MILLKKCMSVYYISILVLRIETHRLTEEI